jgi:uncharacterized glyoxalase superfamily protein PhnB
VGGISLYQSFVLQHPPKNEDPTGGAIAPVSDDVKRVAVNQALQAVGASKDVRSQGRCELAQLLPPIGYDLLISSARRRKFMTIINEVYPYLIVRGAVAAIEFYRTVFGAEETFRLHDSHGDRIGHAELKLGPVTIMLADEYPELGIQSPAAFGGTGLTLHLHVDDVDALAERAVRAGATVVRAPTDYDHGERQCRIRDPFGHEWLLGHQIPTP